MFYNQQPLALNECVVVSLSLMMGLSTEPLVQILNFKKKDLETRLTTLKSGDLKSKDLGPQRDRRF
jgi:hypothetical protein